jgi:hypothetical protein
MAAIGDEGGGEIDGEDALPGSLRPAGYSDCWDGVHHRWRRRSEFLLLER